MVAQVEFAILFKLREEVAWRFKCSARDGCCGMKELQPVFRTLCILFPITSENGILLYSRHA